MASTITVQQIVDIVKTYPEMKPITDVGGFSSQPALSIANRVMQKFLAQPLDWKFNRNNVPPFLTVSLQQDYVTNVTDMGWLEQGWRIDINNTTTPKPIFSMESVRDLAQTSTQANPFNLSWIPNKLAIMGAWQANTVYACGYGSASTPISPIQQFVDVNGNILFINSAGLGLSINSPGFSGTPIVIPGSPYGTSGNSQPSLPANSTAGTTVVDGTVTWTVADPNGYAIRLAPLPSMSGITWLVVPVYQKKPPRITTFNGTWTPIPDEFEYLIQEGFLALAYDHSPEPSALRKAPKAYIAWQEALMTALKSGDREREDAVLYPSTGIMGGGTYGTLLPLGPAWPYSPQGLY